jgi:hypothetical protein
MTALAQGSAGLALVMGFGLLVCGQITAAAILLAVQSLAVAMTAMVLNQPLMAIPPVILACGVWLVRHEIPDSRTLPAGGAKLGIGVGAVLAILCQSLGVLGLPSAIVLLSILLAATRAHPLMQIVALTAMQNGVALAGSLSAPLLPFPAALLIPVACLALPLPLAAGLLTPTLWQDNATFQLAKSWTAAWLGWVDLGVALAILAATLIAPLDSLGLVFAPLLALDGVMRSCVRQAHPALPAARRAAALAETGFTVLAVCAPNPQLAWLAVLAALAMALSWRRSDSVLAFLGAGLALFGLLVLPAAPPILGWFSLFAGFAMIAAMVPDLSPALVILLLRLAIQTAWPPGVAALGIGLAIIALLSCALLLTNTARPHRTGLLLLSQATIAVLAICTAQPGGRFAALVLLILLILSRAAARITDGPAGALAVAGLGGIPPLGVFPGLVLVALTMSGHNPWLLLPLGVGLIPVVLAGLPRRQIDFSMPTAIASVAWLPLALTVAAGYFAPDSLVQWWRILTAGHL